MLPSKSCAETHLKALFLWHFNRSIGRDHLYRLYLVLRYIRKYISKRLCFGGKLLFICWAVHVLGTLTSLQVFPPAVRILQLEIAVFIGIILDPPEGAYGRLANQECLPSLGIFFHIACSFSCYRDAGGPGNPGLLVIHAKEILSVAPRAFKDCEQRTTSTHDFNVSKLFYSIPSFLAMMNSCGHEMRSGQQ
jgi:hypothetical protein